MDSIYDFIGAEKISSPALIFYQEKIERNIEKAVHMAGGANKLWPHVKTHKSPEILRMQVEAGITKFKCATIAEAEFHVL